MTTDAAPRREGKLFHMLRTMLVTGMAYVVNYGITLVLTPYITNTVGTAAYGFVTLAKQFTQYATIVTTALNVYAARYIGIAYHKNDIQQANTYFSSVFWGDLMLGSLIFLTAGVVILFMDSFLSIPAAIVADVKILFLLTFLGFWVTTVFSVFGCVGYVKDRMDLKGIFKTLSYITEAAALIVCYVLFPSRILYMGIGTLAAALLVALTDLRMSKKYLPTLGIMRKNFSFRAVKQLTMEGFWMSFNMVGNLLNSGLDLLVCNQMLSSLAMGQLAIAKTMDTIMQSLYTVVEHAFIPRFLRHYAANDHEKLLTELKFSMKVSGMLANIMFAGFVALGPAFYRLWIPGEDVDLIYHLTVVTVMTCIPNGAIHPLYYIYTLTLKQKLPCYVTVIGGLFNVAGMYVLIHYFSMGVYAVAWTTVAVMSVINFITNPLYMAHVLKLPAGTFYPDIIRNILSCGALVLIFLGLASLCQPSGWVSLILTAIGCAAVGVPTHLLAVCSRKQLRALGQMVKQKAA